MLDHSGAQPWKMKGKYLLVVLFVNLVPGPLAGQDPALLSQACDAGDMQIPGAEIAGVFNMGGAAVTNYVSILERVK